MLALLPPVEHERGTYQIMVANFLAISALMLGEAFELRFEQSLATLQYFKRTNGGLLNDRSAKGVGCLLQLTKLLESKLQASSAK
jgi:hypothetical protein